ncbi:hypothetical protein SAMN02910340_01628 [Methanosarcina thermophila]|mgnify:FL=1|jgi:hypothetical protein|uniref:YhgE/Pip C-terminal domain protein n=2 Tax=Methanosarcina TaxID=2207 RepID=A0A1I6ZSC3_METTE|nr:MULTISPECIES: hypothetical protein [Methanosarcina]ALK06017.1 MAG: hypothetical protein AAY43_10345 [Methanosarcina sp. 795]AYK16159.1 hypothetical protein AOB57_014040 [Methanosarcina flavescens]NLK31723.1 hypothetical protein [Methanosarcina flavescens]NLU58072.1 hypothetical protein [Methanosarcina thermophila]SFT65596.1 hypothetical protein SAMN02910340_01628 [Methanosarcina thermophila]
MVTCIGTAVAGSSADQVQAASLNVTRDGVNYISGQVQIAQTDNGEINQASKNNLKVVYDKDGNIKKVVARLDEEQQVDSWSNNGDNEIDTSSEQGFGISKIENGVNVDLYQLQHAAQTSDGTINQKQSAVVKVKLKENKEVVSVKLKQKQEVKSEQKQVIKYQKQV